jgi:predicted Ser/Thr protein kinase
VGDPGRGDGPRTLSTDFDGDPEGPTHAAAPHARRAPPRGGPKPGDRIGRYVVEEVLGQGGMGVVVAARDPGLARQVALKVVRHDIGDPAYRARMVREARAMAQLEHPHVVRVYDAGDEGDIFIAMELIRGETLGRWMRARARPWREVVRRFLAAGRGLAAAHHAGLVHRDFKPDNVLVRTSDHRICVTDFGLAVPLNELSSAEPTLDSAVSGEEDTVQGAPVGITRTGAAIGTPPYMAPEQHRGEEVDARADIFGFCVSLYEGLYGERPFAPEGEGVAGWAAAIERGVVRPAARGRRVPRAVRRAVVRGLATDPAARWPTMDELLRALERAAGWWWLRPAAIAAGAVVLAGGATAIALAARGGATDGGGPADSPVEPDLAAAHPLTSIGACAEGPAYVDAHTIAFWVDEHDGVHLWAVDDRGGAARRLTSGATRDWRPAPGRRPGEVLYLETGADGRTTSVVVGRDVATGAETTRIDTTFANATAARDGIIYYVGNHATEIRRRRGDHDESYVTLPAGINAQQLAAAPTGDRFAIIVSTAESLPQRMCVVGPSQAPACVPGASSGRPAWSTDGGAVYLGMRPGVVRHDLATGTDRVVVPKPHVTLGVAVSPDGRRLVYTDCAGRGRIADVQHPDVALVDDDAPSGLTLGPGGLLAWVHASDRGTSLMVRAKGGPTMEVVPATFGVLQAPAFSAQGDRVAFVSSGAHVGVFAVDLARDLRVYQLTDGATDSNPMWTRDEKVVFSRLGDGHLAHVFVVDAAGGAAQQGLPANMMPLTANLATGEILLATSDGGAIWWNPTTGARSEEIPAPPDTDNVVVSPNGKWLLFQRGVFGVLMSRAPIDHPAQLERVAEFGHDAGAGTAAIDDDGRVISTVSLWRGELVVVPAKRGRY